ncbi:hypothetical protein KUTeg_006253 [Tegillarca granosa]|uniref:Calponin-homology (CH) domain-containing protein n=1 Tax=Tegillarca granosa TaxID=220873 RepID=A0ABQ9FG01_TEGGR|nr:hypothetical protein KUTeg_006253 [Tegillarca granosa]
MADRVKPMGMDRALTSKTEDKSSSRFERPPLRRNPSASGPGSDSRGSKRMGAKYDPDAEREVRHWFQQLLGEDIGEGPNAVEKNLRNGVLLVNTLDTPFKQMENIEIFLKCARAYGVPLVSCFQTVDLYEGRNLPMVIATLLQVGTEAQRNGFNGPTAGAKPTEKQKREFTYEQLKQAHGVIGLQSGTNKFASQKGMRSIGAVRHIADIRADDSSQDSQSIITLQAGTNKFDSQKGMTGFGAVRHISDIRADDLVKEGNSFINLQAGTNKFDSQKGMRGGFGAVRHISDIRADKFAQESSGDINLQSGTNKFASQKGMTGFGSVRHIADIRADDLNREGTAVINLQYGTNTGDSQKGMTSFGAQRHVSDIKVADLAEDMRALSGAPVQYQQYEEEQEADM